MDPENPQPETQPAAPPPPEEEVIRPPESDRMLPWLAALSSAGFH